MQVTDEERALIDRKLAESRRLGKQADEAGRRVVAALQRAARSRRAGREFAPVDVRRRA